MSDPAPSPAGQPPADHPAPEDPSRRAGAPGDAPPASAAFAIEEAEAGEEVRLRLLGELDVAGAPALERRLAELGQARARVVLDLSELRFIDSTGVRVLLRAVVDAGRGGRQVRVDPDLAPNVRRVLELVNLDELILAQPRQSG